MQHLIRRLIETDEMPAGQISAHARKDQNVKKGHLHTLHVWWATRPLAACRAVLLATLLPDPADPNCSATFREIAYRILKDLARHFTTTRKGSKELVADLEQALRDKRKRKEAEREANRRHKVWMQLHRLKQWDNETLRQALLEWIAWGAGWKQAVSPTFLKSARKLVAAGHPAAAPLVVDPFAGIGSIPFEALRIGADAFAGDLNPVAVLLNKVALEYLPTYGHRLAKAARKWGNWVRERAMQEMRPFYPLEPDGAEPLAYLWARTIRCEGPGCGAEVPLVGLLWLSRKQTKKEGKQWVALRYQGDKAGKEVVFEIFRPKSELEVQPPIVKGFSATCPVCGYTTPYKRVREQIRAKRGGTRDARMIAVITLKRDGSRGFRLATEEDVAVAGRAAQELARRQAEHQEPFPLVPDEPTPVARGPGASRAFSVRKWGMETWGELFTPRQALALSTFVRLVREAHAEILQETGDAGFARSVTTCLAVAVSNMSQNVSSQSQWLYNSGTVRSGLFGNSLPMRPDFAELNVNVSDVRGLDYFLERVAALIEREGGQGLRPGTVRQGSATAIPLPDQSVPYVVTDPPYYDAVPYASLSDFCYVWLRRMLYDLHPDLFGTPLTPKAEECIMDPGSPPPGEPEKTREFFETTMERALAECRRVLRPDGLAVVLFAHKGTAGWEALVNALVQAGWTVASSWPIETEDPRRMRAQNSAVLASSVFLVCRPRPPNAGVGDWRRVLEEMNRKVAQWLPRLEREGIHGADAIFACIGPTLEVYSRYERVETAGGHVIPLGDIRNGKGQVVQRGFLSYVWEAVAREALKIIFPEADPTGFEEDARVTAVWLWTLRARANGAAAEKAEEAEMLEEEDEERAAGKKPAGYTLPYDDARLILQALGAHEERLRRPGGILEVKGDTARLRPVAERRRWVLGAGAEESRPRRRRKQQPELFEEAMVEPETQLQLEPGSTTLDRLHQAMLLFTDGRSEALRRFLVEEGVGKDGRFWRLADALSRLYPTGSQEKRWVDGLLARKRVLGL